MMRSPASSVLSCLPVLAPQCLLLNFDKQNCLSILGRHEEAAAADDSPAPAPREVFPREIDAMKNLQADTVVFQEGYTMLKGRVGAEDADIGKTELQAKCEGDLKLWNCTVDLVETMRREIKDGQLSFRGKRVLELGCCHGLSGIFAMLKGAATVHFQDTSDEVLTRVTAPNVAANLERARTKSLSGSGVISNSQVLAPDAHYYAGDWRDVHELLSVVGSEENSDSSSEEEFPLQGADEDEQPRPLRRKRSNSSRAFERALLDVPEGGYDIILLSETVYSQVSLIKLYDLIKKARYTRRIVSFALPSSVGLGSHSFVSQLRKIGNFSTEFECLRPPYGVLYIAARKHHLGVDGGARQFKSITDEEGVLGGHLVTHCATGLGVREVWKFFFR